MSFIFWEQSTRVLAKNLVFLHQKIVMGCSCLVESRKYLHLEEPMKLSPMFATLLMAGVLAVGLDVFSPTAAAAG